MRDGAQISDRLQARAHTHTHTLSLDVGPELSQLRISPSVGQLRPQGLQAHCVLEPRSPQLRNGVQAATVSEGPAAGATRHVVTLP